MNNLFSLVNQLQPGDVLVVGRNGGIVDHYIVYMGEEGTNSHWFIANMESGVVWLRMEDLKKRAHEFHFRRIRRFSGNHAQRIAATKRAQSRVGEAYSLVSFNCEHFANYVQFGQQSSQQVQVAGLGLLAIGIFGLLSILSSEPEAGTQRARYS